ncbi:transglycosylase domain-containing protein [Gryllotalpicola reticulitermitis]|uniref:Transglycosylase domain-containing protein n=1 Tax=Gryllotalpicola reticulitermitis TaxID=1184153 RepID=A0ABV8Q3Z6_9MICO
MRFLSRFGALIGFIAAAAVAGILATATIAPLAVVASDTVNGTVSTYFALPDYLKIGTPQQMSTMYAQDGHGNNVAIASFYSEDRVDVASDKIAQDVKDAAIDTEDPRFYSEGGVDPIGTVRAMLATAVGHGGNVQGGSTITQQYVKNILVQQCENLSTTAKIDACYKQVAGDTPKRKVQEIRYASAVDRTYSKTEVLTGYLNIVGLGGTVYGVQAGARYYFDTDAAHLTIPQAATLVAILNNPSNLRIDQPNDTANGAKNHYAMTLDRRNYVLGKMKTHHSISETQYEQAIKTPITPHITPQVSGCSTASHDAAYYCSYVQDELLQDPAFGKTAAERATKLATGGLRIYTPLRLDLQTAAQSALSSYVPASTAGADIGGSDVTVQPGTGHIETMVQNTRYSNTAGAGQTSVNYNADENYGGGIGFQTGSTFKAFSLVEWLRTGHTLNQYVSTTEHSFNFSEFHNSCENIGDKVWNVGNSVGDFPPPEMTVQAATAQSINTAFAQMGKQLDLCAIAGDAKAMGIHVGQTGGTFSEFPSMILGVNDIAPLTMATAYAGFADSGKVCTPVAITEITDVSGHNIPFTGSTCHQAIAANLANTVEYALRSVLQPGGTGATANPNDGVPMFAKTGTTDSDVENWLVGGTTNYTTAIWEGNEKGQVGLLNFPLLQGTTGYTAKFSIAHALFSALNPALGGAALPGPDQTMVGKVQAPAPTHPAPRKTTIKTTTTHPAGPTAPAPAPAPAQPKQPPAPKPPTKQGGGNGGGGHH